LIKRFMAAPEFNNGGRFVAGLYAGLLDRDAEYSGWLFQRNALATQAVTLRQLVVNFINSAEWRLKFGSPDNAAFVRLLYRKVLLREPAQPEVDFHVSTLTSAFADRVQMAANFLNSIEFRNGTGPRLTAFLLLRYVIVPRRRSTRVLEHQNAGRHWYGSGGADQWNCGCAGVPGAARVGTLLNLQAHCAESGQLAHDGLDIFLPRFFIPMQARVQLGLLISNFVPAFGRQMVSGGSQQISHTIAICQVFLECFAKLIPESRDDFGAHLRRRK
jgi:hypothetical protein